MGALPSAVPPRAGVGLKPEHFRDILEAAPDVGWFEVHAENYMGAGGPPHHFLTRIREAYALSVHGVGLSIGGAGPLDRHHLARLKGVVERYEPGLVSEHLAWSSHDDGYLNDLLPLPYTAETAGHVSAHIDEVQEHLGRRILLENPATYLRFAESTMGETAFLEEVARRTGCGLLLDVNNVFVSCTNHAMDPYAYLDAFPLDLVGEVHLAGHAEDRDGAGRRLLIDTHDRPVIEEVWALFAHAMTRGGRRPTLIEWDTAIPEWATLHAEARRAEAVMADAVGPRRHAAVA